MLDIGTFRISFSFCERFYAMEVDGEEWSITGKMLASLMIGFLPTTKFRLEMPSMSKAARTICSNSRRGRRA